MKNKGFTLVELLAVIAILAILVIVAMPNVLGMFNDAKVNVFVTDVQKIIDAATTAFTKDALNNAGKTIYYSSVDNDDLNTKKLNMSGFDKEYFIEIDRNGNFKRVVVYDSNYCYDIYTNYGSKSIGNLISTKSRIILNDDNSDKKIEKSIVLASDVYESGNDSVDVTVVKNGSVVSSYVVRGCDSSNELLDTMIIDDKEYKYIPGMTWEEWVNSEYNTNGFVVSYIEVRDSSRLKNIRYYSSIYSGTTSFSFVRAWTYHQIIRGEKYFTDDAFWSPGTGSGLFVGETYYDFNDNGGNVLYNQIKKINSIDNYGGEE